MGFGRDAPGAGLMEFQRKAGIAVVIPGTIPLGACFPERRNMGEYENSPVQPRGEGAFQILSPGHRRGLFPETLQYRYKRLPLTKTVYPEIMGVDGGRQIADGRIVGENNKVLQIAATGIPPASPCPTSAVPPPRSTAPAPVKKSDARYADGRRGVLHRGDGTEIIVVVAQNEIDRAPGGGGEAPEMIFKGTGVGDISPQEDVSNRKAVQNRAEAVRARPGPFPAGDRNGDR